MAKDAGFEFAKDLLDDPAYIAQLKDRLENGTLSAQLEKSLWDRRFGKPAETIQLELSQESLEDKSPEQLAAYLEELKLLAADLVVDV